MTVEKLFEDINVKSEIIEALRRQDRSYIKGVIQWYERYPKNPFLVPFLKKAVNHFKYV